MERERRDIFFTLRLAYVELAVEAASSLVLFYDPVALAATLETQSVRRWLAELGYPETGAAEAFDAELVILGTSTWGCGEAQDDWAAVGLPLMEAVNGTPRNARKGAFRGGVSFLDGVGGGPQPLQVPLSQEQWRPLLGPNRQQPVSAASVRAVRATASDFLRVVFMLHLRFA